MIITRAINKLKRDGVFIFLIALVKYPFQLNYRLKYKKMLTVNKLQDKFIYIYDKKIWLVNDSLSGEGSELKYTENLREWLICNLPSLKVNTFVDAPCGDFNWMRYVLPSLNVNYVGLDIVPSVIKKNRETYNDPKIQFKIANICEDKLPSCELIMVRDVLFHLSFEDINSFFINLAKTDYKYLLTTTHKVKKNYYNTNITSGDSRLIDLFAKPFNFKKSKVIDYVNDYPKNYNKSLDK